MVSVSNGVIILSDIEETFYCGELKSQDGAFSDVVSFEAVFYILSDGEKHTVYSHSVIDTTGNAVDLSISAGSISGEDAVSQCYDEALQRLEDCLYVDVSAVGRDGSVNTYSLQLTVRRIN